MADFYVAPNNTIYTEGAVVKRREPPSFPNWLLWVYLAIIVIAIILKVLYK